MTALRRLTARVWLALMKPAARVYYRVHVFRDHLDSWCADDYFTRGVAPGVGRRAWLAAQLLWLRAGARLVCALRGHVYVDADHGDPEVGPQPQVYCERCGR